MQTTAEVKIKPKQQAAEEPTGIRSLDALCDRIVQSGSERVAWKHAAEWLASTFNAPFAIVEIDTRTGSSTIIPKSASEDTWEPLCDALLLKSRQEIEIVSRASEDDMHAIAIPMRSGDSSAARGGLALVIQCQPAELQPTINQLLAYVRICETTIAARQATVAAHAVQSERATERQGVSQAGGYKSLHQYAFAITNGLKAKLNCDEVAIGVMRNDSVRILSISGMDSLHPRTPGSKAIQQAMEEAADAATATVSPTNHSEESLANMPLIDQWRREANAESVACIPLEHGGEPIAVISLKRTDETHFTPEELQQAHKLVTPLASGLLLLEQANESLATHVKRSLGALTTKWTDLSKRTRTIITVGTLLIAAWALFGSTTYTLQVPCEIVASESLQIAAPFEGRMFRAHVRPGDRIKAGQTLIEFDTNGLDAEYERLEAELRIAEIATLEALRAKDISAAGRARNEADAARADLSRVKQQMIAARIVAPFDGYVLEGDIVERVGETVQVGTELIQIARTDRLAVDIQVHENDATYVTSGQVGQFRTNARPGETWDCELCQIDASSSVVDGQNVFMVRAEPTAEPAEWLRPGMQGVARIEAGSKPVWWVYLHGATDWVRMQVWKL